MYSIEGLKNGIEQANKNVEMYKTLIEKEKFTAQEYEKMIKVLEEKEELTKGKTVEVIRE